MFNPDCKPKEIGHRLIGEAESFYKTIDTHIHTVRKFVHSAYGSTISLVDGPEVPEDRDPAQREAEGPRSSMDYSEFPLLDFSHQKKTGAPASPHRVTTVPFDVQWKGQRSQWRYMEKWEKTEKFAARIDGRSAVTVQGPQKPRPDELHFHSNFERECL